VIVLPTLPQIHGYQYLLNGHDLDDFGYRYFNMFAESMASNFAESKAAARLAALEVRPGMTRQPNEAKRSWSFTHELY
jgi:hypothetical protein